MFPASHEAGCRRSRRGGVVCGSQDAHCVVNNPSYVVVRSQPLACARTEVQGAEYRPMGPLTIGALARRAGVGVETVRFYERHLARFLE